MPADITLYADQAKTQLIEHVDLGETLIEEGVGKGEARLIFGSNTGTTVVRDLKVGLVGDGASHVQLAINDLDGRPGLWAEPGTELAIPEDAIFPGQGFTFWARPVYAFSDHEATYDMEFVIRGISVA